MSEEKTSTKKSRNPLTQVIVLILVCAVVIFAGICLYSILNLSTYFASLESTSIAGITLSTLLWIVVIAAVAVGLERTITRYLSRFARRAHLAPNVANNLILTFRLLILIGFTVFVIRAGGLPTEWLVTFSALGGAAVGFASTKTIGNFIAGLYLLAARPFRVGDYVRIGTVEGIVEEMAINYTKILTIGDNVVSISNLQIMDRDITNFHHESSERDGLYCYTFEVGFDHSVPTDRLSKIFNEVFRQYEDKLQRKPSYMLVRSGGFDRVYIIYLYVKQPQEIFDLRPRIAEEIFRQWDKERKAKQ